MDKSETIIGERGVYKVITNVASREDKTAKLTGTWEL